MQTPKEIGGIQFGLMDPETYRDMSATKVITADTYDDDGYPIDMGLMDPRLGVIDPGLECRTCGQHSGSCNGHFGHIELAAPVIHVGFTKLIRRLLRSTCRECGRLALTEEERDEYSENLVRAEELGNDPNDVLKAAVRQARKQSYCPFPDCDGVMHDIKHEKPTTYYEVQDVLAGDYSERIAEAMQPDPDAEDDEGTSPRDLAEAGHYPAIGVRLLNGERYLLLTALKRFFQEQCQAGVNILTPHAHGMTLATETAPKAGTGSTAPATTEDFLKKVTELSRIGSSIAAPTKTGRTLPAGRTLKRPVFPGPVFPELVVFGSFLGVFQYFVGLADVLEHGIGVLFLADVRMVFPRQLAVGLLDFLGGGRLAHTEHGVIVLEIHSCPRTC